MTVDSAIFDELRRQFEQESGLIGIDHELLQREGSRVLVLKVANPNERLFAVLERVRMSLISTEGEVPLATLAKKTGENVLRGPEGKLLLKTLSESLNINRYSFQVDFLSRYTQSVTGAEEKITAAANHVVFGRRGAGKSTLLLYALHTRNKADRPCIWIDMQVYSRRDDDRVIADVLSDLLSQVSLHFGDQQPYQFCVDALKNPTITEAEIRTQLPAIRRLLSRYASQEQELFIFLDDFHVLTESLQPRLLDVLYAVSRGNRLYLKISSIETLTRTFDPGTKKGLEIPHDAQIITLDYNLTMPDKATQHIETILDSHAIYCGLPSIRRLCTSSDVVPRLTWVAAGVPRDGLYLFSQAISKATLTGSPRVSVSNVNVAASEAINIKLRELEADASGEAHPLKELLESIREFCVKEHRRNAFLVEIKADDSTYEDVRKLVDLRLLHVINEGITISEVGRKFLGLILDYGFYTGFRAARSVGLITTQLKSAAYKNLRKLPVFERQED